MRYVPPYVNAEADESHDGLGVGGAVEVRDGVDSAVC